MNSCRVPDHGPSKPSLRSRRIKSLRLHGLHRLTPWLPIQVDAGNNWQGMAQLKADQNPILQRRAKLGLALTQGCAEGHYPNACRDTPKEGAVLQLVVNRLGQSLLYVVGKNELHNHGITGLQLRLYHETGE